MILVGCLCLYFLQGVTSLQMFLIANRTIVMLDTKDKSKFHHLVKSIAGSMDYHYTNGHFYYVERGANSDVGELYRLNLRNREESPVFLPPRLEVVVVDWVHNELFGITLNKKDPQLMKYDLNGNNPKTLISTEDKANLMKGITTATTLGKYYLCVDPYEGVLIATIDDYYKFYMIKTDLNGNNLTLLTKSPTRSLETIAIEVHEKRIYLVRKIYMETYDYNGKQVGLVTIGEEPYTISHAFDNRLYMLYRTGYRLIIAEFVIEEDGNSGHLDEILNTAGIHPEIGVVVYDPRRQRRRTQGKYECERQDCEQGCEVNFDHGDTCFCSQDYFLDPVSNKCIGSSCRAPSGNRVFSRYPCPGDQGCVMAPGTEVSHSDLVNITCKSGYTVLSGDTDVSDAFLTSCYFGSWRPRPPNCYKLCPPLVSLTVKFTCYQGPRVVSCEQPVQPGTIVEYSCKEYHDSSEKTELNGLTCTSSGEWSGQIPQCIPQCGKSNLNSHKIEAAILGEKFSEMGNFPWHAGLYHFRNGTWEAVCGGTLISPTIILTAAHCVTSTCRGCKSIAMSPSEVKVALGKRYRSWSTNERFEVKKAVKEIRVHKDYVGSSVNYGQDIAILIMESAVEVTNYVMPACVDFSKVHLSEFTEDRTLQGYAAGWGNTEECSSFGNVCDSVSEELKYAKTAVIFFNECFSLSQSLSNKKLSSSRLTSDKFCSGNGTESVVQKGDSGGGLTFVFDGLHFVFGVVSLKLKLEIGDRTFYSFGAFTSVPHYLNWLQTQFYEISISSRRATVK